jgi:uncharacterized protein YgiM (DUF1202 family)
MKVTSPTSIREGPSVSSAIIGIAHLGAEAQVVSRDSDWVQIIDPGSKKTGWINQSFLEPSSQPASKEEVDAALAAPAPSRSNSASADRPAYAKSRAHKHSWKHKRHRRGFALGFFRRRFW